MSKRKSQLSIITFLTFIFIAFIEKNGDDKRKIGNASTQPPEYVSTFPKDTTPSKEYLALSSFFSRKSDQSRENIKIPFSIAINFLSSEIEDTSSVFYSSINPVEQIKNMNGNFFILRVNCTSGGDCAVFYLLYFDYIGKFIKSHEIGNITAEEEESQLFDYELESDSVLRVYQITYDNQKEKGVDTSIKRLRLKNANN